MSERGGRARWHDNGRGPRVVIDIGSESVVTTADHARELRDDLTAVLDEIRAVARRSDSGLAKEPAPPDLSERHLDELLSGYSGVQGTDDLERMVAEIRRHRAMVDRIGELALSLEHNYHPDMRKVGADLRNRMKEPGNG